MRVLRVPHEPVSRVLEMREQLLGRVAETCLNHVVFDLNVPNTGECGWCRREKDVPFAAFDVHLQQIEGFQAELL